MREIKDAGDAEMEVVETMNRLRKLEKVQERASERLQARRGKMNGAES